LATLFAPWVAPHNPFDLRTLNLLDAFTPPAWSPRGNPQYFLGTDDQGRDVISAIIFGSRMSLTIGLMATLLAMTVGVTLGLITESSLSFLGVGVPPTQPSLGTLIRIGNDFLFSGEWWITVFPGAALVILVLSINVLGDWLRDALNPRLR